MRTRSPKLRFNIHRLLHNMQAAAPLVIPVSRSHSVEMLAEIKWKIIIPYMKWSGRQRLEEGERRKNQQKKANGMCRRTSQIQSVIIYFICNEQKQYKNGAVSDDLTSGWVSTAQCSLIPSDHQRQANALCLCRKLDAKVGLFQYFQPLWTFIVLFWISHFTFAGCCFHLKLKLIICYYLDAMDATTSRIILLIIGAEEAEHVLSFNQLITLSPSICVKLTILGQSLLSTFPRTHVFCSIVRRDCVFEARVSHWRMHFL